MVTLLLASVFAILRYDEAPSRSRLAMAAVVSSLAFVVKPGCVFAILGAFVALAIARRGMRRAIMSGTFLVFITITLLPTLMIYLHGILTGRFLVHQAEKTVLPQLWVSPFFWRHWLNNIEGTIGFIPFIGALLGALLLRSLGIARSKLLNTDAEHKVRPEQEIGELVNHSTKTIFLSSDYGVPLEYHGLLSDVSWPLTWDLGWEGLAGLKSPIAQERFNTWYAKEAPNYFIIMESLREFERQPDLEAIPFKVSESVSEQ